MLTDSGGYQIFSLPEDRQITEQRRATSGASTTTAASCSRPRRSIAMQQAIGSDIMMVLDVCIDSTRTDEPAREAMERTHRWALRSLEAAQTRDTGQALFAIVQGGVHPELRDASVAFLTQHPVRRLRHRRSRGGREKSRTATR